MKPILRRVCSKFPHSYKSSLEFRAISLKLTLEVSSGGFSLGRFGGPSKCWWKTMRACYVIFIFIIIFLILKHFWGAHLKSSFKKCSFAVAVTSMRWLIVRQRSYSPSNITKRWPRKTSAVNVTTSRKLTTSFKRLNIVSFTNLSHYNRELHDHQQFVASVRCITELPVERTEHLLESLCFFQDLARC